MLMKRLKPLVSSEDWWSIWLGALLIASAVGGIVTEVPRVARWSGRVGGIIAPETARGMAVLGVGLLLVTWMVVALTGGDTRRYPAGFASVFIIASVAQILGSQQTMAHYGFNNVIWALGLAMVVANTVALPPWVRAGVKSGLFIRTGLVLLGAEIIFGRVLSLGAYGLLVAWAVTPVVLCFMYLFGTRVLRIDSRPLVATIAAATSVCGVSAAVAAGAATGAEREEISYAVSLSLIFTVVMMVLMPLLCRLMGLTEAVSGAWIGGTVDSTGAVVAAGALVGPVAMQVAAVIKMIQNVLIGIVAFVLAVIWTARSDSRVDVNRPRISELYNRFPKFILGFAAASMIFSLVLVPLLGSSAVDGILGVTSGLRGWLFCLAFTCIGLEANLRAMARLVKNKSPLFLYGVGQLTNLVLTLLVALLVFGGWLLTPPL